QASSAARGVTSGPHGLARFGGDIYVADTGHHRVMVFPTPLVAGMMPTRVYGQPDDRLALANSGGTPGARTLAAPRGVFADAVHLVVADTGNHRVLVFDRGAAG